MHRLRIAHAAADDLEAIFDYGAELFGQPVASGYRDGFNRAFSLLCEQPLAARARPDLGEGLRSKPYRSHLIVYRVEAAEVLIVRVLHGAMDARRHLR